MQSKNAYTEIHASTAVVKSLKIDCVRQERYRSMDSDINANASTAVKAAISQSIVSSRSSQNKATYKPRQTIIRSSNLYKVAMPLW